ncbi:MAG TPA: arginase family protein, partial [Candidatus Manganitrophaceae bacterium]|nr:arginase family protein [Candidatus Manganitrophaceae bacterium]
YVQPAKIQFDEEPASRGDLRLRHLIRSQGDRPVQIGLLGVPSDAGVIGGGGRAGAALGPNAVREQIRRYGTAYNFERQADLSSLAIADFGDLTPDEKSVEETHRRLTDAVAAIVRLGAVPIVLGGGHDLTFGGVRGLAEAAPGAMGGLALDAHFDVRETVDGVTTSGTPFRNILEKMESVRGECFVEIGGNGLVNARSHFDFLLMKKARIFSLAETRRKGIGPVVEKALQIAGHGTGKLFCSIDLDAVAQAFAPGVSAPSPEGFTPEEVSLAAYLAGLEPKTAYFDIMELNPAFDQDGRTARLAVGLILHFLAGVALRKEREEKVIGFRGGTR